VGTAAGSVVALGCTSASVVGADCYFGGAEFVRSTTSGAAVAVYAENKSTYGIWVVSSSFFCSLTILFTRTSGCSLLISTV